jgi:demethylmenaquinone methyltransferase/2-methoxy-6-polyprenyl-1,4-benzoquinol methylase
VTSFNKPATEKTQSHITIRNIVDHASIGTDDWADLQSNLEATIPVYDRINRFATFGQDQRWRKMVQERLPNEGKILEIGCGPGSFAENLSGRDLTCLDPIPAMLAVAKPRVNKKRIERGDSPVNFIEGTAESLPFEDSSFDGVCSLFSFRDWYDKRAGLSEALRVLKPGGKLVIVDPAKINRIHGWLGYLYMRIWVGSYARFVCKQKEHPWKWLTKTYVHFGTTRDYVKMMKETGFIEVKSKVIFPGMATIWVATKKK